jgi:hypothetical protein
VEKLELTFINVVKLLFAILVAPSKQARVFLPWLAESNIIIIVSKLP